MKNQNGNSQVMDDFLREKLAAEVSPEVENRLRLRLTTFREQMEKGEEMMRDNPFLHVLRKCYSTRIGWAASGLILAVVVALIAGVNPWTQQPGLVFADVIEKVRNTRTAIWTHAVKMENVPDQQFQVMYMEPSHMRLILSGAEGVITVADLEKGKSITLIPEEKKYIEISLENVPGKMAGLNIIENLSKVPVHEARALDEREMDNRTVKGFLVSKQEADITVWVDSVNGDLVQVEIKTKIIPESHIVMSDFELNVDLADSLFKLTIPEGYTRHELQIDLNTIIKPESKEDER